MTNIIDGKSISEEILGQLKSEISSRDLKLKLGAILVGDDQHLGKFLELKRRVCEKIGVEFRLYQFPANSTTNFLRRAVVKIGKVKSISGIIVELPLPSHLNTQYLLNAVPEEKDIDVLSQKSQGAFFARLAEAPAKQAGRSKTLPPSVETVKIILGHLDVEPKGKRVAIFGYGLLVGKPIAHWLTSQMATVSTINEFTENPGLISSQADIVISGIGKAGLIKENMIKDGAIVIDFGFNESIHNDTPIICGDVDFEKVSQKAFAITPVPGGVGPIVIAAVLKNLVSSATSDKTKLNNE